ncbi:SGNH/GDSL hydrolase family protein [Priestia flexa]|uniref:SGNH/GDSL hydrolase family protein n=1 Tax=Priestia flexa TaxID=86664 RepID=UPI0012FD8C39|nr:SGNH/GDSL hydrolase family protein [Priestia flexa]MEC0666278.1 SGNH/GDSL hydrolase family protein [Priestia flexa]
MMKLSFDRLTNALVANFRNTLNKFIGEVEENFTETVRDVNQAKTDASAAVTKADEAKTQSNNTQAQVDALVVGSNTSPAEAVQARVGTDGQTFATLKQRLDNEHAEVTAQLAEKASKQEIQNIGNASPKGVYATLSALQTAFPTGTTGIYLVTADGKWYYWNNSAWTAGGTYQSTGIAENTITAKELNVPFINKVENLFRGTIRTNTIGLSAPQSMPATQRNVSFGSSQKTLTPGYYIVCVDFAVTAMDATFTANLFPQLRNSDPLAVFNTTAYTTQYSHYYSSAEGLTESKKVFQTLKVITEATYGVGLRSIGTANNANFTTRLNDAYVIKLPNASYTNEELAKEIIKYASMINKNGYAEFYSELFATEDFKATLLTETNNRLTNIEQQISDDVKTISCWGDSLTASSYPTILQSLVGSAYTVNNFGVGGENSKTIAARQGGLPMIADPFTIPSSGAVTVTFKTYDGETVTPGLQHGFRGVNPCYINGIEGNLSLSNGVYSFTRSVSGNPVVVNRPTAIITNAMKNNRSDIIVIWMGQNDGVNDATEIIRLQKLMVDYLTSSNKQYLIIGLSSSTSAYRATMEQQFKKEFGRRFINIRDYLSKYGLEDAGIQPTQQDLDDMTVGAVPTSLRTDTVHFNTAGNTVIANQVYKRLVEMNIVK